MKIKCEFCGNMINDTLEQCPNCGAPNQNVRRSAQDQPTTIEELKRWYSDRGLPPYETTRFFIGEDYRKPRAFGIYQDPKTGNYVVYKNKDSGQRAIRYEGTDEAFAVHELLERLKQEILQQKSSMRSQNVRKASAEKIKNPILKWIIGILLAIAGVNVLGFLAIMAIGWTIMLSEPKVGYYEYENNTYYHSIHSVDDRSWSVCVSGEWSDPLTAEQLPDILEERKTGKQFFLQEKWDSSLSCPDFDESLTAQDLKLGGYSVRGYFIVDGVQYYHLDFRHSTGWYVFTEDWQPIDYDDLPLQLQHNSLCRGYSVGDAYDAQKLTASDFTNTIYYKDSIADTSIEKGYYQVDNITYYHLASDYSEGWYSYQDDEWSAAEYLPEEFSHPSTIEDFYYTPDWNSETQITDFTDTALYSSDKDNWNNSSDSDSSSYDWDSGSSWDSGDTDWGSDW